MSDSPTFAARKQLMLKALEQAQMSQEDVPVGAVMVKDGNIIGLGANERERKLDPTGHAEIVALKQAAAHLGSWRVSGCELYVTLEPCAMCAEALIQARVSTIVFGAYDPKSGACGSAFNLFCEGRVYPIPEVVGGIMEDECKQVLVDFFRKRSENGRPGDD